MTRLNFNEQVRDIPYCIEQYKLTLKVENPNWSTLDSETNVVTFNGNLIIQLAAVDNRGIFRVINWVSGIISKKLKTN